MKSPISLFITTFLAFSTLNISCMDNDENGHSLEYSFPYIPEEEDEGETDQFQDGYQYNNPLLESLNFTSEPTPTYVPQTEGLGILWGSQALFWNKRDIFLDDLRKARVDINNQSYHRLFNSSISEFAGNNESDNLTTTIILSNDLFKGILKPGDIESTKAHLCLVKTNEEKQKKLTETLFIHHTGIINELNNRVSSLKKLLAKETLEIEHFLKQEEKKINDECNEIRRIKKALLLIHKMNTTFVLNGDGYCSDKEQLVPEKIKSPNLVSTFYDNKTIFRKIKMNEVHKETTNDINFTVKRLQQISANLNNIPLLTYGKQQ